MHDSMDTRLRSWNSAFVAFWDRFCILLEPRPAFFLTCFTIVYAISSFGEAYRRPLWLDEIVSVYICQLPRLKDVWATLLQGLDGNPPLFYLVTRPLLSVFPESQVCARLSAIIGFWVAGVCLFVFVRRRTSTISAGIATLLFAHTGASYWASEARPYGMGLGLVGLAIVCWQRCGEDSPHKTAWLCGLALSIAAAVSTHYFYATVVFPLLLGEGTRWLSKHRIDWPVCFAVLIGAAMILLWSPLLWNIRSLVLDNSSSPRYYATPSFPALIAAYAVLISPLVLPSVICLAILLLTTGDRQGPLPGRIIPVHEVALGVGFALAPIAAFVVATFVTGAFLVRYALPGALGAAIVIGFLVHRFVGLRRLTGLALLAVLFWYYYWLAIAPALAPRGSSAFYIPMLLRERSHDPRPIVITEGLQFVPIWYYAPASLRSKLFYATDLAFAKRTTDISNEKLLMLLRPMAPESILDLNQFVARRKEFLVYYLGESANSSLDEFLACGCSVRLEGKDGPHMIFSCKCE